MTFFVRLLAVLLATSSFFVVPPATSGGAVGALAIDDPLDPQRWQDQQDMTWADYRPVPGATWADPARVPTQRRLKIALVAVDFSDQAFVITQPKQGDPFGNPQIDPIARANVAQFYASFWGTPSTLNHGHTVNEYWMEQTNGRIGVTFTPFGPYRMPRPLYEYGLNDIGGQQANCPAGHTCNGSLEPDADALWRAAAGSNIAAQFDLVLRIYAGYDETSVWQEFGEMKFQTRESVPDSWGPPDPNLPNWAPTRYVPWTSWRAGAQLWGSSSMRQGESSGTITHEIVHTFGIADNNNNPYAQPYHRVGSGPWDVMDRGSFNGPGGPHMRWVVPATMGAAMPAGQTLRSKTKLGHIAEAQVLRISRDALASTGMIVATVKARSAIPNPTDLQGMRVELSQDRTPACSTNTNPLCAGSSVYNFYSVETVQRIGADSFTPDNGVLLAKNKNAETSTCGYLCFTWVIDANPQDINRVDFTRPDGTPVMRSIADYRQLNDALFHAGTNSGSQYEFVDSANRLHFYILSRSTDANGVLSYRMGVRSLDGRGPQPRGVSLTAGQPSGPATPGATCTFPLRNTGTAAGNGSGHPENVQAYLNSDVYRLTASVTGTGYRVVLPNALASASFGNTTNVTVNVAAATGAAATGTVTLRATSESDPSKTATATCAVTR
ncbi:peptidase M6 [Rhizocola hellebori]|uniref:Peptidase M6 n=1 Tax=Rhizocola hellebori TaxID=1392758 RepID=A0A8J3Q7W4_9ACTN|nr:peptidase M6 [Rhizocola hellebori]GIH05475.1 peptidase M6 [Rhizocola hellebori]